MSPYKISWNRRTHKGKQLNVACIQIAGMDLKNVLKSLIDDFFFVLNVNKKLIS